VEGRNDAGYPKKIEQYLVWGEEDFYQITLNAPDGWPISQYSFPDIEISMFEPPNQVTFMIVSLFFLIFCQRKQGAERLNRTECSLILAQRDWRPALIVNDEEVKKSRYSSETVIASIPAYTKKYKVVVAPWQVVFFGSGWEGICTRREWTSRTEVSWLRPFKQGSCLRVTVLTRWPSRVV
jgi:hypothetical protein